MTTWERIRTTTDIELMADGFDTWEQFAPIPSFGPSEREIMKYGSVADAEFVAARDAFENDSSAEYDDAF